MGKPGFTYENAGVSIQRGNDWVSILQSLSAKYNQNPENSSGPIGGFAGLYPLGNGQFLAACADGVGSKQLLAKKLNLVSGIGQDLVAMNLNDLVTVGAKPLFFMDYIACKKLEPDFFSIIMEGIFSSCASCGCMVLGGETAEIPQLYKQDDFDLAGFCVGLIHEDHLSGNKPVASGDILIGLPSSGLHSNGYTLVNKILDDTQDDTAQILSDGNTLADWLTRATRLYVNQALNLWTNGNVKAMAHITGGGLTENVERVLNGLRADIDFDSFQRQPVYDWLSLRGVHEEELRRVFNLGIGFVVVSDEQHAEQHINTLKALNESPVIIGRVV